MLTILEISSDGRCSTSSDAALVAPAPAGALRWINIMDPTPDDLALLAERFDFHPLSLEDCKTFEQRPRFEDFRTHAFVVVHRLTLTQNPEIAITGLELHAFIGNGYLVTVHSGALPELDTVRERILGERDPDAAPSSAAFIYYLLASRITEANFDVLDALFDAIENVEDSVLKAENTNPLADLFTIKRALAAARRLLSPQRDVFATFSKGLTHIVNEHTSVYFRKIYDGLIRMSESIETNRDILSNVLEAHFSIVSNRTNEIMKSLTLLSAIFLPLSFVVGFFGQNFEHLPYHSTVWMWFGIGVSATIPPAMLLWFRSRNWM